MDIRDLLLKNVMIMDLKGTTKEAVINEMVDKYHAEGIVTDADEYRQDILKREAESTTGIGEGIAMPHAKDSAVTRATVLFAKSAKGVDFNALDGQPVHLFFMIAAPEGANNEHLAALAALSSLLINPKLVADLKQAKTPDEVLDLFGKAQAEKVAKDKKEAEAEKAQEAKDAAAKQAEFKEEKRKERPFIVAVTACPTGIAHTYMAEAALKETAEKMGVDIKVETNGSEGIKHKLTDSDINRATGVIVAADKKVEMDRFNGKKLLNRPVIDGIKKPEELIEETLKGQGQVFHASGADAQSSDNEETSGGLWNRIYKDLMNGVSNMLPFVVGGGIIMAISFILEQWLGKTSMWFTFTNNLGTFAFSFLVPVLAAYIAESIGDRPALMPGFVGGYMATVASASVVKAQNPAGFLGGLVAGFAAGWMIVGLKKALAKMPKSLDGMRTILLYPVIGLAIMGLLMFFIINPIFAAINGALISFLEGMGTGNAILIGVILAAMMSIDMGGPFNKAAYTFAIGVYQASGFKDGRWMAAVMIGGMIPPLAIAVASTFFPKKFTLQERNAGLSNYALGLTFITEGAIPFAATDPVHIIGSSVVGSAIAGGLTQLWHVNVPAPHGGIVALLLTNQKLGFVMSLIIGTVIAALILGFWRPVAKENQ
ncbi:MULTISPECIES: fructose-specific PTS transporter subunit EIIC [Lacticaseibacillus]|uniref:Fructose-specific PTS transporter subunit EIIC n=2 Tax=Lacticaseibacillus TaxID=2759736 RepID=A0AAN1EYM8_LACCA|nr:MULTISPECIES: fructose-specific PTS transporter subunit EIIC [Lacticaseibacillus]ARY91439.1 PTS fructose transporter subunit IIC [Lacticaseibacillus casei]KAB1968546.1 PTS fructose transporter subunit IIC [Lacticaseibacillus casei]WLV82056.1 fructose-specific PTS transporter subunit EIIC [Lacticaseibacillus sp. NCIMB 15473]WNX25962.1 fructose-specific PTS transporter subunit EIIC [Lacticaseibacillus casei]WNX28735.1 fructose-specific PTS transporter subunit EIIC [Lacticaseibacillus casei]